MCWMLQQNDKKTGRPKVWIYRDKATGLPKGEATITYEDDQAASSAIEWFNSKNTACFFVDVNVHFVACSMPHNGDRVTRCYFIELLLQLQSGMGTRRKSSRRR